MNFKVTELNSLIFISFLVILIFIINKLFKKFNDKGLNKNSKEYKDQNKSINTLMREGLDNWYRDKKK